MPQLTLVPKMTAWLFVITPIPVYFFWPGFLLPSLMAAFLTEGSKFLIFDTKVCRSTAWFPSGTDSLPRVAEECSMGETGAYAIASVSLFFVALILVCLKAPEKRPLEPNYGTDFESDEYPAPKKHGQDHLGVLEENHIYPDAVEETHLSVVSGMTHPTMPTVPLHIERQPFTPNSKSSIDPDDSHYYDDPYVGDGVYDDGSSCHFHKQYYDESSLAGRSFASGAPRSVAPVVVSESRLRTKEKMQRNTEENSTELIDKFVRELNVRFDVESS